MKLEELLSVCNLNCKVDVYRDDFAGELLTSYDGKNSIDSKYNDWIVCDVYASDYKCFDIYVKEA